MKKLLLITASLMLLFVAGCKKYPEGPSFSLLTKKSRLCGEWKLKETVSNGTTTTNSTPDAITLTIKKDGTYTYSYTIAGTTGTSTGKWEFASSKEHIKWTTTNSNGSTSSSEDQITKLESKEIWFKDLTNSSEDHWIAK